MNIFGNGWFTELSPDQDSSSASVLGNDWKGQAFSLEVDKVLFHDKSKYQDILVFKSKTYGNVLVLDGVIQCTERDEFAYHESIAHLALFSHPNPKKVLIIGGGDGGVVREVLKHKSVEKVVLCELDELVVKVSQQYLPSISKDIFNPKVELVIHDGLDYLKHHQDEFDVIITDSSDPQGPAEGLFGLNFYKLLYSSLKFDGLLISQGECPWIDLPLISNLVANGKTLFPSVKYATSSVPTYTSGTVGYILCSKDRNNTFEPQKRDCLEQMDLRFYTYELHQSCFALPLFVKRALDL